MSDTFDRAAAVEEIRRIVHSYPELSDAGDIAGVGALYAGVEMGEGEHAHVSGSAEEAERTYRSHVRFYEDGLSFAKHLITNMYVELSDDGQEAVARSAFVVMQARPGFPLQFITTGHYEDRLVLTDGAWKLVARQDVMELVGDLTHHLSPETLAMIGLADG